MDEFKASACLTKQLIKKIAEHDKDGSINKDGVKEVRRGMQKQRERDQNETLKKILGELLGYKRK